MKQICVFILVLMLASCEYFNVKKTSSEAILEEELQTFNWNDVDEYPTFSICDSLTTKQEKKQCFGTHLTNKILNFLQGENITITQDVNDTITLKFQVSEKGKLSLLDFEVDSLTLQEIPNIKVLIRESLVALPQVFPAIKRAQQVKTEFELPIIINVR
ncbi:MAG: hypothetical protein WA839_03390 [Flavobacteriaceae bacterium]|tara:strand:- start:12829 stop:13305 length:477 start_codon:yes stop_codon:yes gene_type:complete